MNLLWSAVPLGSIRQFRIVAETLRRQGLSKSAIARQLDLPDSTIDMALLRLSLSRLAALEPGLLTIRYEQAFRRPYPPEQQAAPPFRHR